jgi:hypothetical protein
MQYDVKAAAPLTATGQVLVAAGGASLPRTRIKGVYYIPSATAGSIILRDGGGSGVIELEIATPAAANAGQVYFLLPGEGILFETNVHGTLTNVTSVTVFYG